MTETQPAERYGSPEPSRSAETVEMDQTRSSAETAKETMWRHWLRCRSTGETPNGAELYAVAGTNNYGRGVLRAWLRDGQITQAEFDATRLTGPRRRQATRGAPALAA
jgi:hypothetical protein